MRVSWQQMRKQVEQTVQAVCCCVRCAVCGVLCAVCCVLCAVCCAGFDLERMAAANSTGTWIWCSLYSYKVEQQITQEAKQARSVAEQPQDVGEPRPSICTIDSPNQAERPAPADRPFNW